MDGIDEKKKEGEMDDMDEEENGLDGRNGQEKEGEEEEMDAMDEEESGLDGRNGQEKENTVSDCLCRP